MELVPTGYVWLPLSFLTAGSNNTRERGSNIYFLKRFFGDLAQLPVKLGGAKYKEESTYSFSTIRPRRGENISWPGIWEKKAAQAEAGLGWDSFSPGPHSLPPL